MKYSILIAALAKIAAGYKFIEEFNSLDNWVQPPHSKFIVKQPSVYPGLDNDTGLVAPYKAAQYSAHTLFDDAIAPTADDKPFIVQYEVKLQQGLDCGGAYLKLLSEDMAEGSYLSSDSPYTIMFGPDKCGSTNKVHFIFKHKNPVSGEVLEHHLINPPSIKQSKTTSLYTLVINPDNEFEVRINNDTVKKGSLLTDFDPPVNPPTHIHDPSDSKPVDWVEEAVIADPHATKPADWDESQPRQIHDPAAVKPDTWNEELPSLIPSPDILKPDEWDDEEDGEFVAPLIPNPSCEGLAGCGKWTAPLIANPEYKGVWTAPMIVNPDYKGPWSPREIENPAYFEDQHPHNLTPIKGVGFEIWTMSADILFDNVFVGDSVAELDAFTKQTYAQKKPVEEKREREALEATVESDEKPNGLVELARSHLLDFLAKFNADPVLAFKERWDVAGALASFVAALLALLALVGGALSGGSASEAPKAPIKASQVKKDEKEKEKEDGEDKDEATATKASGTDAGDANLTKRK
ncbi:hypothetical protein E3P99_03376 [Wallemia hederae]|uniref:Calnexin n=1 Tax=Wallemia hederae TaxID=1540922 RepID=A0A4T0FGF9_9BASI|nr:hypothetical protein E3P99_03376 [Wallemia hederae]